MRIHILKHGTLADDVNIVGWAEDMEHTVTKTILTEGEELPGINDFDWLIILGGIMDTHEVDKFPWLVDEKKLIREAVDSNKIVLGICLGSQLLAEALGAKIRLNENKEVGWQGVRLTEEAKKSEVFGSFPEYFSVFQWHSYTFDLPEGAVLIAENNACRNQAFEYNGRVIGTQFHPEFNNDCIRELVQEYYDDAGEGPYIQAKEAIMTEHCLIREIDALIDLLLTNISDTYEKDYE